MKKLILLLVLSLCTISIYAQTTDLPRGFAPGELDAMPSYLLSRTGAFITNPPASPVRTIGEWEELQGLTITWTSYQSMLREIVRAAKQETRVYILTSNTTSTISYLAAGGVDTVNVTCLPIAFNSVWSRDYGLWSAYTNDVDSLLSIDWIYNRPRPLDDAAHVALSQTLGIPVYQTNTAPNDLIHTGGNFMTDGFGTGFSSNLILNENPGHTGAEVDSIMNRFMGINRYIKMGTLPYDQIHHIDMHMKLLDEETILMGQYPAGVADGPQIEANLLYVLSNYNSVFGTPYKVIRMPMPSDNGQYPSNGGRYFTYTNASFINKTIIVPTYGIPEDTTALRIYREALPGYTVTGINSLNSISALGALHCITKEIGTWDPLLISHQPLPDTYDTINDYAVDALMKHRSGIAVATLWYRTDTLQPYLPVTMTPGCFPDHYLGLIPPQPAGTTVYYYLQAEAVSGKQQMRPMPAPAGYWKFRVLDNLTGVNQPEIAVSELFPNPSKGITCVRLSGVRPGMAANIVLRDVLGRDKIQIFNGLLNEDDRRFFFDTGLLPAGLYQLVIEYGSGSCVKKLVVK